MKYKNREKLSLFYWLVYLKLWFLFHSGVYFFFLLSFFFMNVISRNCQSNYFILTPRKNYHFSTVNQFLLRWAGERLRWERFWSHEQCLCIMTTESGRKYGNGVLICALICKIKEVATYQIVFIVKEIGLQSSDSVLPKKASFSWQLSGH